jgi:beta-N-acetylhexosaminidase
MKIFYFFVIVLLFFNSCNDEQKNQHKKDTLQSNIRKTKTEDSFDSIKPGNEYHFTLKNYYSQNRNIDRITDSVFNTLSDEQRIGQMIITSGGRLGKPDSHLFKLIKSKSIGGILLLGGTKTQFKEQISKYSLLNDSLKALPLIFSADAEPGLINTKIGGLKKFNPANSIKTEIESFSTGKDISDILKEIGINQNYAPVCDIAFNKEIIGDRSFGNDEKKVIKLSESFINATQDNNIIATAKHFPGHGSIDGDTHKEDVTISGDIKELNIFKEVIKAGVISIMVGHIIVENRKYSSGGLPSTLSRTIVTDLLKKELGFKGIVITDGMNMKAVTVHGSSSLKAVLAGCDMILMPADELKLIYSVKNEMDKDEIIKKQVYESVKKIIRSKICLGLIN